MASAYFHLHSSLHSNAISDSTSYTCEADNDPLIGCNGNYSGILFKLLDVLGCKINNLNSHEVTRALCVHLEFESLDEGYSCFPPLQEVAANIDGNSTTALA